MARRKAPARRLSYLRKRSADSGCPVHRRHPRVVTPPSQPSMATSGIGLTATRKWRRLPGLSPSSRIAPMISFSMARENSRLARKLAKIAAFLGHKAPRGCWCRPSRRPGRGRTSRRRRSGRSGRNWRSWDAVPTPRKTIGSSRSVRPRRPAPACRVQSFRPRRNRQARKASVVDHFDWIRRLPSLPGSMP